MLLLSCNPNALGGCPLGFYPLVYDEDTQKFCFKENCCTLECEVDNKTTILLNFYYTPVSEVCMTVEHGTFLYYVGVSFAGMATILSTLHLIISFVWFRSTAPFHEESWLARNMNEWYGYTSFYPDENI
jgi:hypothetical protein